MIGEVMRLDCQGLRRRSNSSKERDESLMKPLVYHSRRWGRVHSQVLSQMGSGTGHYKLWVLVWTERVTQWHHVGR